MSGTRDEFVAATLLLDEIYGGGNGNNAPFERFAVDSGEVVRQGTAKAVRTMQEINLGDTPLIALSSLFTQGVLLGLAIAEQRGMAVDRLIEEAS